MNEMGIRIQIGLQNTEQTFLISLISHGGFADGKKWILKRANKNFK
jgi:hypothetical protein